MRFGSICSGIEAASCAWEPLGWKAAFLSEIEPFPCAVLDHHYPAVPNLGDMTKFKEWKHHDIDVLVGGTPCQSFSVAGLRKGLDDPRGNLMLTYLAIADRYRPEWLVWENVPGVLSSNGGRDFGTFLGGLGELGYGFAYRVLDAQFFGVAQRRRRVFVVGCLGDWRHAAAVLFERDSLSGHSAPSRQARKDVAPTLSARTNGGGGLGTDFDCDGGLVPEIAKPLGSHALSKGRGTDLDNTTYLPVAHSLRGEGFDASEDGTGRGTPIVPISYGIPGNWIGRAPENGGNATEPMIDIAPCLTGADKHGVVAFDCKSSGQAGFGVGEISSTLRSMSHADSHQNGGGHLAVAIGWPEELTAHSELAGTLQYGGQGGRHDGVMTPSMQVRRLTPVECERLQGFKDNYTLIQVRGKPAADGPRYKALGNSMAVPVMRWIGERIQMASEIARAA